MIAMRHASGHLARVIEELGFPALTDVDAIAESFRTAPRRRRRGLYVLYFANGEYYLGETLDILARLRAHRRTHRDITQISFKPVGGSRHAKLDLRYAERIAIATCFDRLRDLGVHTRGIAFVPRPTIETDFDFLMPAERQRQWETDLGSLDLEGERPVDEHLRRRYQSRFDRFWRLPQAVAVTNVLRRYLQLCIPACLRGESWFWACSCQPSGPRSPLVRVNVGWQAALDVVVGEHDATFAWYMPLDAAERFYQMDLGAYDELERSVIDVENLDGEWLFETELYRAWLKKGGANQVGVEVTGTEAAALLLQSANAVGAFRRFNLGLLNQGPTPWGGSHCFALADHFFNESVDVGRLL